MNIDHSRYTNKIRQLLLGAGRVGISQYDLNQRTRTKFFKLPDMLQILEDWEARQWVQKFQIRVNGTRKTTMWRATTELVAGFQNVHLRGVTPKAEFAAEPESPSEETKISAFRFRI